MKNNLKFVTLGGIILSIIGMLLPFYGDGEVFINGLGVISLIFLVISLPFIFIYSSKKLAVIFILVSSIVPLYKGFAEEISNVGIGFYVIIVGIITALISQILVKEKDEPVFDNNRKEVDLKYYQKPVKDFERFSEMTKDGYFKRKEIAQPSVGNTMPNNTNTATNSMGYKGSLTPGGLSPNRGLGSNMFGKNH